MDRSDKALVNLVEERYESVLEDRRFFDKRTMTNRAQYGGKHRWVWSTVTNRLEFLPEQKDASSIRTFNLQLPMIQRMSQRMSGRDPVFKAVPATHENEDVQAAAACDALIKHYIMYLGLLGFLREDIHLLSLIDGHTFLKLFWNTKRGRYINLGDEQRREGDVDACTKSTLMVSLNPDATKVQTARWLIEHVARSVDDVEEMYGVSLGGESLDEIGTYQLQTKGYFDDNVPVKSHDRKGDYVMVKEYWEAPCRQYPYGRVITTAAEKLLDVKEQNPYFNPDSDNNGFPYVQFKAFAFPERLQGISPIQQGQAAQEGMNAAFGKIESYHKRTKTLLTGPPGSLYDGETYDDRDFELFEYKRRGEHPTPIAPPALSNEAYAFVDKYHDFFRQVTMAGEAMEGGQLANVRSADHWMAIQEATHQQVGPIIRSVASSWQDTAKWIVEICRKFMLIPKMVKITGKYASSQAAAFTKSDLMGSVDIWMLPDSLLPYSQPLKMKVAESLYDKGMYGPPGTKLAVFKFQQHVGTGNAYLDPFEDDDTNMQTAVRENGIMNEGKAPKGPAEWHNHEVHEYVHLMEMNQPDFLDREPMVIKAYQEHLLIHKYMQLQTAMNLKQIGVSAEAMFPPAGPQQGQMPPQANL